MHMLCGSKMSIANILAVYILYKYAIIASLSPGGESWGLHTLACNDHDHVHQSPATTAHSRVRYIHISKSKVQINIRAWGHSREIAESHAIATPSEYNCTYLHCLYDICV